MLRYNLQVDIFKKRPNAIIDLSQYLIFRMCKHPCAKIEHTIESKTWLGLKYASFLLPILSLGASEPKHMAYMVRLGIWGPGSPFRDFNDFLGAVEKRGVGAMEIVAMDMKLRGMYIARQLSFQVVTRPVATKHVYM